MTTFDNIKTLAVGASGVGAVEITSVISEATTSDGANIVQVVIQIIIGVATLIGMFRKKSTNNNK